MKRTSLGVLSIVVLLALALLLVTYCAAPQRQVFHVGLATWPGFGPGFVAKEKGFFGDLKVDFAIIDDFSARQNAFTSGKTVATISTLDSFAFEAGQGVEGKVVFALDESNGADGIVVAPDINSAAALKGKKVAYTRGSPSHFFLIEVLKREGLDLKNLTRVEVDDPARAGEAFVSGSVSGAVTWEPNITQIVSTGKGRVLESTKTFPGLIVDVMVLSPQALKERKGDVKKFVEGWLRAVEFIKTNQTEAYAIMARQLKIPEKDFPGMAVGLKYADRARNDQLFFPEGKSRAADIFNEASEVWSHEGLIKRKVEANSIIDTEFLSH